MKLSSTYAIVEAVVRYGSFRKAADKMAITSTALNRRVLTLEQELGVDLFERLPHGVQPTIAGEIMVDHVRKYFADLERVKSTIADLSGVRKGHVSISTSIQLGAILPEEIARYRAEHSGVTFDVNFMKTPEVEASLADHSADIGIVLGELDSRDFWRIFPCRCRSEFCCARAIRLRVVTAFPQVIAPSFPSPCRRLRWPSET